MRTEIPLLNILQAVSNHTVERRGLNQLIELTQSFTATYMKYRYKNLGRALLAEDITINEMAMDAIAPLFERDESGILIRIKNAFENWDPKIETEAQAVFFINRLAAKSAEKYVSEILRESDPFFSKILRSVDYLINKNGYRKKQILGTTYIVHSNEVDAGRLPSAQFIYDLPAHLLNNKGDILKEIFGYLTADTDKAEAIPLNALVIKIKKTVGADFNSNDITEINSGLEIDSIVNKALQATFDKLQKSYLDKKKIDNIESAAFKEALKKIADDLIDGGINTGLHKYIIEAIPDLGFQDYRKKYQNMLEYLYKLLKKEIIDQMEG
jgi:hypothetical protein